jgi:hypothetical protein
VPKIPLIYTQYKCVEEKFLLHANEGWSAARRRKTNPDGPHGILPVPRGRCLPQFSTEFCSAGRDLMVNAHMTAIQVFIFQM